MNDKVSTILLNKQLYFFAFSLTKNIAYCQLFSLSLLFTKLVITKTINFYEHLNRMLCNIYFIIVIMLQNRINTQI